MLLGFVLFQPSLLLYNTLLPPFSSSLQPWIPSLRSPPFSSSPSSPLALRTTPSDPTADLAPNPPPRNPPPPPPSAPNSPCPSPICPSRQLESPNFPSRPSQCPNCPSRQSQSPNCLSRQSQCPNCPSRQSQSPNCLSRQSQCPNCPCRPVGIPKLPVGGAPKKGCPTPPGGGKEATCPIDTLKLGACVDLLGGLVHVVLGDPAVNECCPIISGLAEVEAAVCLCTTLKIKALNLKIFVPLALELLVTCGKTPPPGYTCAI